MGLLDNLVKLTKAYDDVEDTFPDAIDEHIEPASKAPQSAAAAEFENQFASRTASSVSEPEIENDTENDEDESSASGGLFSNLGAKLKHPVVRPRLKTSEPAPAPVSAVAPVRTPVQASPVTGTAVIYSFNDITRAGELAQIIAGGRQVIMSIDGIDDALARRLLDVTIGICAACNATITKVSGRTYYVTPNA